ncbi:hypothetical protein K458DRAFT_383328 [Lentithecium fluviatile CBS 122367]|uniref:Uncharacterized protein n=1 Tax=Lentithecium fluviatile CBS 122367 TaxID=1168545 RepID=A0A6G1JI08_9PLEO|nr:hypothetical protein K458DRAFT_383328 [Lentithecium fluviatile CBS 122367]
MANRLVPSQSGGLGDLGSVSSQSDGCSLVVCARGWGRPAPIAALERWPRELVSPTVGHRVVTVMLAKIQTVQSPSIPHRLIIYSIVTQSRPADLADEPVPATSQPTALYIKNCWPPGAPQQTGLISTPGLSHPAVTPARAVASQTESDAVLKRSPPGADEIGSQAPLLK